MNGGKFRKKLSHLRWPQHIPTWQLALLLVPLALISATFLRFNNLNMVDRRDAVIAADASGDEIAIRESLVNLQSYVSAHMNTNLGDGVFLEETYSKASQRAVNAASDTSNPQSAVYQQASIECRARFQGGVDSFRNDYVTCVINRVSELQPAQDPLSSVNLPKVEDYRYDFASPVWSPDAAGLSLAVNSVILVIIFWRIISHLLIQAMLKRRYREQI